MSEPQVQPPRIGARLLVELLRLRSKPPETKKIRLTPERSRHAFAVLMDKLHLIQQRTENISTPSSVAQLLIEYCGEFEIALPIAESDWGAIQIFDDLYRQLDKSTWLDAEAKTWFDSLQLTVLRYALMDYSFFFARQNLLRRFLNQSYFNLLSNTEQSRDLYRSYLAQIGQRMLSEFRQEVGEINSLCIEAQAHFAAHSQKVDKIEHQLKTRETTRRRERTAEQRVTIELNRIASKKLLPEDLQHFLLNHWRNALLLLSMKEGSDGVNWKRQLGITESMVDFSTSTNDEKEQDKFRHFYPILMKNVKSLLVESLVDKSEVETVLEPLELLFQAMLQGIELNRVVMPEIEAPNLYVTEINVEKTSETALKQIAALEEGQWVRLKMADGRYELCRLTLKASGEDAWVFVSQSGKTIAKKNEFQLAQAYDGGVLEIYHHSSWWDKVIEEQLTGQYDLWQQETKLAKEEQARIQAQEALKGVETDIDPEPDPDQDIEPLVAELTQSQDPVSTAAPGDAATQQADNSLEAEQRVISDKELNTALSAVEQIQIGGWITRLVPTGEERCKLAVKIRGRDKLVFVNRLGVKSLEIEKTELARLLVYGSISIVDTGSAFDSTLERVVRTIQKGKH